MREGIINTESGRRLLKRVTIFSLLVFWCAWFAHTGFAATPEPDPKASSPMTAEKAIQLAEKFGVDVGEVDEEIKEILGLNKAEGVVVFAVIGGSPAELSGIKVKAVIKEVDIFEIRNLIDLGNALEKTMSTPNFTVATYEPMSGVGVTGGLNFHFVRILQD